MNTDYLLKTKKVPSAFALLVMQMGGARLTFLSLWSSFGLRRDAGGKWKEEVPRENAGLGKVAVKSGIRIF